MKGSGYVVVLACSSDDVLVGLYEDSADGRKAALARMHEVAANADAAFAASGHVADVEDLSAPQSVHVFQALGTEFKRIEWVHAGSELPASAS